MNSRLLNSMFMWTYIRPWTAMNWFFLFWEFKWDIKEQMKNVPYISRWMAKCTLKIPSKWIPYSDSFFKANSKQRAIFWEAAVRSLVVVVAAYKVTAPAHTLLRCVEWTSQLIQVYTWWKKNSSIIAKQAQEQGSFLYNFWREQRICPVLVWETAGRVLICPQFCIWTVNPETGMVQYSCLVCQLH